jgi:hypothetical protein
MFTDERRCTVWDRTRQLDLRAFGKILTPALFQQAAQAAGVAIRKRPLNWANMVWLGIAAALHTGKSFADILVLTFKILDDMGTWSPSQQGRTSPHRKKQSGRKGGKSKHGPHGNGGVLVSEEAFVDARKRMPMEFWLWLLLFLAAEFQTQHAEYVNWKGFRLLALDGTEIALQRDRRLADHFGTSRNGKRRRTPQARMLMMMFPLARVPWRYELAPRSCHEQKLAARMLPHLEVNDLLLMDRGFWSFGLFWMIQRRQAFFGIRLRRGVKVKHLQTLGRGDSLVSWKPAKQSKQRRTWLRESPDRPKALTLRVIRYRIPGFRPSAVVTNVLDPKVISADDWVRLATENDAGRTLEPGLYHRRWEIETMFRELKVVQGMKRLRSRTPESIYYEVAGHVLLYTLTRWLMVEAAKEHGIDPLRISFTHALRELTDMRQALLTSSPQRVAQVLLPRLRNRIVEHLVPLRPGRHYPRPTDHYRKGKYRQAAKIVTTKA